MITAKYSYCQLLTSLCLPPVDSSDEDFFTFNSFEQSSVSTKSIAEQRGERDGSNQIKRIRLKFSKVTVQ